MLGDQEDGGVEGAADVPETAGFWPAGGSVGMEKASVIVPRSYCFVSQRAAQTFATAKMNTKRHSAHTPNILSYRD